MLCAPYDSSSSAGLRQHRLTKASPTNKAVTVTKMEDGDATTKLSKVIVVGGSGRVGGSTVRALRQLAGADVEIVVGGRSEKNFRSSVNVSGAQYCTVCLSVLHCSMCLGLRRVLCRQTGYCRDGIYNSVLLFYNTRYTMGISVYNVFTLFDSLFNDR